MNEEEMITVSLKEWVELNVGLAIGVIFAILAFFLLAYTIIIWFHEN